MKRAVQSGLIAALFGIVGLAAGVLIVGEPKTEAASNHKYSLDKKLRQSLSDLHVAVKQLQTDVKELQKDEPLPRTSISTQLPKTTELPSAPLDPSSLASMANKIRELESRLAMSLRSTNELSLEELLAKFDEAMKKEDGKGAMEALKAVSKLKAYGSFTRCYGQLKEAEWLGLRGPERRGWGSSGLYHWLLTSSTLGVDGETALELQKVALDAVRRSDEDKTKVVSSLAYFLSNLPIPEAVKAPEGAEKDSKDSRRNRRNRRRGDKGGKDKKKGPKDIYRIALLALTKVKDSAAIPPLGQVLNNQKNPSDVRIMAMRGLIRQEDPAGVRAVEAVLSDSDEVVRRQAEMALQIHSPAASGYLVTKVGKDSPAAKAGLASGQIITAVNGKPVKNGKDIQKAMKKLEKGKSLKLTVYSSGSSLTMNLIKEGKRLSVSGRTVKVKAEE